MADSAAGSDSAAASDAADVARLRAELEAARAEASSARAALEASEASAAALRHELHALRDPASRTATPLLDDGAARRVSPQCKVCGAVVEEADGRAQREEECHAVPQAVEAGAEAEEAVGGRRDVA